MDSRAAHLDRDDGVEGADGGLKGFEVAVLVGEDTEVACVDTETDTGVDILLGRLEPGVTLSLLDSECVSIRDRKKKAPQGRRRERRG